MELSNEKKLQLKKRAVSLIEIPPNYQVKIEDYAEDGAMFAWINEGEDKGITIQLDQEGNLISLRMDAEDSLMEDEHLELEKRRDRAEQFLREHYAQALEMFTLFKTSQIRDRICRFEYKQLVMDLPLSSTGCMIDVAADGTIVNFSYKEPSKMPEIPQSMIEKSILIEHVRSRVSVDLSIVKLYKSIYDVKENEARLVYVIEPHFMKYKAEAATPILAIDDVEEEKETLRPLIAPIMATEKPSIEEVIGITDEMEVLREVDMGSEKGIVWRERGWQGKEQDLSIQGFFERQTSETVKAIVSAKTGRLRSFIWFKEREGNFQLGEQECLQKALDLLALLIPNPHQHLKQIVHEGDEGTDEKCSFHFQFTNKNGVPVFSEVISVAVNRKTGLIDLYNGPGIEIEEINQISAEPVISKEEAKEIFLNHLDFKLSWDQDYDEKGHPDYLVYEACDRDSLTSIRFIDAMTGTVICSRH